MKFALALKALFFASLFPGMVTLFAPYLICRHGVFENWSGLTIFKILAFVPGLLGVGFLISCIWDFAAHGQGTLAPMAPPKMLVTHGFYRYTRNPMYLGVLGILLSEALIFSSLSLSIYAALVLGCFHLFIVGYEEPHLRREFGEAYTAYCRTTPRWGVRFRTARGNTASGSRR